MAKKKITKASKFRSHIICIHAKVGKRNKFEATLHHHYDRKRKILRKILSDFNYSVQPDGDYGMAIVSSPMSAKRAKYVWSFLKQYHHRKDLIHFQENTRFCSGTKYRICIAGMEESPEGKLFLATACNAYPKSPDGRIAFTRKNQLVKPKKVERW